MPHSFACQVATYGELKILTSAASLTDYETVAPKGRLMPKKSVLAFALAGTVIDVSVSAAPASSQQCSAQVDIGSLGPGGAQEDTDARRDSSQIDGIFTEGRSKSGVTRSLSSDCSARNAGSLRQEPLGQQESRLHFMSYKGYRFYRRCLAIQSDDCRASGLSAEPCRHGALSQRSNSGA